ncbi:unnamed protein product [Notodromas monacha]|uniref:Pre-mRNA polyadenylation factor Fip1 domain-containing protein n=1 Tax=Notodromas monacha TaxID=399045 RepID=A0A7R9GB35_9CRUS|nr:unnamed protein product [Notodromas monacha]CAG0914661.1 unnamed protein product [Notodromas monacha]
MSTAEPAPDDDRWLYGDEPEDDSVPGENDIPLPEAPPEPDPARIEPSLPEPIEDPHFDGSPEPSEPVPEASADEGDGDEPLPKQTDADDAAPEDDAEKEPFEEDVEKEPFEEPAEEEGKATEEKEGDSDSDSSDDNVNITIGENKSAAGAAGYSYGLGGLLHGKRVGIGSHIAIGKSASAIPVAEIEGPGFINGKPAYEYTWDNAEEYPWRKPGADITDYFNYGFTEESWRAYCDRQRRLRVESGALSFKQGHAIHAFALQPNLNPQSRHRDHHRDRVESNGPSFSGPAPKKTIDVIGGSSGTSRRSLEMDESKAIQVLESLKEDMKYEPDDFRMLDMSMPPPDMSRPPPVFPGVPPPGMPPPRGPPRMDFDYPLPPPGFQKLH